MPAVREHRALDPLFYGLSSAADHSMLWLALGALRAARHGDPAIALRFGAIMTAESILTNGLAKSVFGRLRPEPPPTSTDAPLPYGMHRPITSSFPSGHAAAAFTAATVLSKDSTAAPALFGLAALVAASRVYVRMHHTSDVLAGAAMGLAFGTLARKVVPLRGGR